MCDIDLLISLVKQNPCLWNVDHTDYHNASKKDQAWKEICKEMCENWDRASSTERKRAYLELKKKWNNIRDGYRKDITKNLKLGRKFTRYKYAAKLEFMEQIILRKKSVFETISCENIKDESQDSSGFESEFLVETYEPDTENISRSENSDTQPEVSTDDPTDKDDDTLFLLSLRGHMKEMSRTQKINFKIAMLNLVRDYSSS